MHADLLERCRAAREHIEVPPFPLTSIRTAAARATKPAPRRRTLAAAVLTSLSIVSIAAAAEVLVQTHIHFPPAGGMVISSDAKPSSRAIHSEAEIREAAEHLDFPAILPSGLPEGTQPVRLTTAGSDLLAIDYDLPGVQRRSHHMLWVFLANPSTMAGLKAPYASSSPLYRLHMKDDVALFRAGAEQVIMVSNGLTATEFAAIKRSMEQEAAR